MTRVILAAAMFAGAVLSASAQQPTGAPPAAPAQPPVERPASPPAAFTYDAAGRRDPFVSLVGRGSSPETTGARPPGLPGMLINEISLKGIMKERSGFIALVQGPDKKTYAVRQGQRLLDGSVKSITQDGVVFSQDVNDPLSLVKQKEIRKTLRSGEGNRG
jgi:Tfp pilus assembly protein PilP